MEQHLHLLGVVSNIHPFLARFWSPPTPETNNRLFRCYMRHYVHQLVANSVKQVAYSGVF